jgi:hypothetical protein
MREQDYLDPWRGMGGSERVLCCTLKRFRHAGRLHRRLGEPFDRGFRCFFRVSLHKFECVGSGLTME